MPYPIRFYCGLCVAGLALLALASQVAADDACSKGFADLIEKSVPRNVGDATLMARLLKPEVTSPQLSKAFKLSTATEAVGDRLVRDRTKCPSASSENDGQGKLDCTFRNTTLGSIMRVKLDRGKIAYLNPTRGYDAMQGEDNKVPVDEALKTTLKTLQAFGVPSTEVDQRTPVVRPLMVAGKDPRSREPHELHRAELHLLLDRHIGNVPVFDSDAKAAINTKGEVARLHIQWPDFHLAPGLSPRLTLPRRTVVQQLDTVLKRGHQCDSLSEIKAHIAYVRVQEVQVTERGGDEGRTEDLGSNGFVPALVVYAVPTEPDEDSGKVSAGGQQFTIPLLGSVPQAQ